MKIIRQGALETKKRRWILKSHFNRVTVIQKGESIIDYGITDY